jgi:VanZ family protein
MVPRQLGPYDKVVHFTMYGVFAGLITLSLRQQRALLRLLFVAVLAVSAFGAADEWHQQFIPGRSVDVKDWMADSLGGVAGVLAGSFLISRSKRQHA